MTHETSREFTTDFRGHGKVTVPKGTRLTHRTALGIDPNYNFVDSFSWVEEFEFSGRKVRQYGLIHDLSYYGLNVPPAYVSE